MGKILKPIFGGSSNKSTETSSSSSESLSENKAYGTLLGALKGNIGQGNEAMTTLGGLLGIGDPAKSQGTLKNFLDSVGFNFIRDEGMRGIEQTAAAKGALGSGAALKDLTKYNQNIADTHLSDLMNKLTTLGGYGLDSANTISSAGNTATSKSTATGTGTSKSSSRDGVFKALFPGGLSDPRLKCNVQKIGSNVQGIGIYEFEFKAEKPRRKHIGVMATEVKAKLPEALGAPIGGYLTVDYSKIVPLKHTQFTTPVQEVFPNV